MEKFDQRDAICELNFGYNAKTVVYTNSSSDIPMLGEIGGKKVRSQSKPIKVFVSYSTKDIAIVSRIVLELDNISIYTFFAAIDLRPGMDLVEWVGKNIDNSTHILLFWSKNASSSYWVKHEWQTAFNEKIKGKKIIIPVILDDTPLPSLLRNIIYIDGRRGIDHVIEFLKMALLPDIEYKKLRRRILREITRYDDAKKQSWQMIEEHVKKDIQIGKHTEFRIYDIVVPTDSEGIMIQTLRSLPIMCIRLERKERRTIEGRRYRRYTGHFISTEEWFSRMEENMKVQGYNVKYMGKFK